MIVEFEIGDQQPLLPLRRGLQHEVDRSPADDGARRALARRRIGRFEKEIAGLAGGEPKGRGRQHPPDRGGDVRQQRPPGRAGDQGHDHPHVYAPPP